MPLDADALREWSHRHDSYDVSRSRLVRGWLAAMNASAGPLARRRVSPDFLTGAGVCAAAAAVPAPPVASALLVLSSAVFDGLDGAVAVRRNLAGRRGERIDHTADRIADLLFAAALWQAGAAAGLALAAAAATVGYESLRSMLRRARRRDLAVVTMGERPIRVAVVAAGLVLAPSAGAALVLALCVGAVIQLLMWVRGVPRQQ